MCELSLNSTDEITRCLCKMLYHNSCLLDHNMATGTEEIVCLICQRSIQAHSVKNGSSIIDLTDWVSMCIINLLQIWPLRVCKIKSLRSISCQLFNTHPRVNVNWTTWMDFLSQLHHLISDSIQWFKDLESFQIMNFSFFFSDRRKEQSRMRVTR